MSIDCAVPGGGHRGRCILHLSDLHFGTDVRAVTAALQRLSARLEPDCLLVSGDITQRARRAQFRNARQFLEELAIEPMLVVPGNHDIPLWNLPLRILAPYRRYTEAFPESLDPVLMTRQAIVCGFNSTRRYRHVDGTLSGRQIERLRMQFSDLPGEDRRLRIVVLHHPAKTCLAQDRADELRGSDRLLDACAASGVDLVMGGHIHRPYLHRIERRLRGTLRSLWIVQAGTATSHRTRDDIPNSVNAIRYLPSRRDRTAQLERWDFDAASESFVRHSCRRVALDDR